MNELTLHPNVYATGQSKGLVSILERVWLREQPVGEGTLYLMSGFANYNGGVRFYPVFRHHIERGGKVVAIFGGSTRQNLSSKQVVAELLDWPNGRCHQRELHGTWHGTKCRNGRAARPTHNA